MEINDRIRSVIKDRKLTIDSFANALNEKPQRLKDVLRGKQKMPHEMLEKIIKEFDVDANWLICGINPPSKERKKEMGELLRESREIYNKAVDEIDYKPPPFLAEHIKALIFTASLKGKIEVEHIAVLLEAIREELD